jgi:hypothetical protein
MEYNMIQIIGIIVTFTMIVISHFGHGKYDTYFLLMNKYQPSPNLLLFYQVMFHIIQICGRYEKKETVKQYTIMSVIICVNT